MVIRPASSTILIMAALVSVGPILFMISIIFQVEILFGIGLLSLSSIIWLSVATVRVKIFDDRLEKWVFWRRRWSIAWDRVLLKDGRGGDFSFVPALIVMDKNSGEKIGEILKPQFNSRDIDLIRNRVK